MQAILDHFRIFPVSTRDQLLRLFYGGDRKKVPRLNEKLLRLRDRGLLDVSTEMRPYVYFAVPLRIHKRSNHLLHHLAVVDFYLWLLESGKRPEVVAYEHSFGRGLARPDLVLRWGDVVVCVELQRTLISQRRMERKVREYEETYMAGAHKQFGERMKVWIVTPHRYEINTSLDLRLVAWRPSQ